MGICHILALHKYCDSITVQWASLTQNLWGIGCSLWNETENLSDWKVRGPIVWRDFSSLQLLSSYTFSAQRISLSSSEVTGIEEEVYKSMRYKTYLYPVMYGLNRTTGTKIVSFSRSFLTVNLSKHGLDFPIVKLQTEICRCLSFFFHIFCSFKHTCILLFNGIQDNPIKS